MTEKEKEQEEDLTADAKEGVQLEEPQQQRIEEGQEEDLLNGDNGAMKKKRKEEEEKRKMEEEDDEAEYEKAAKFVAEKVRRQQEGLESAMLPDTHKDETFRSVDEIQALLESQVGTMAKSGKASTRMRGVSSTGDSTSSTSGTDFTEEIGNWFTERAKYIPLRLTMKERKRLRLIEAIMKGSEYTDLVDGSSFKTETRRIHREMQCVSATLSAIAVSLNYEKGSELVVDKDFAQYSPTFQRIFEYGRRYKVMNPEKMRSTYGKMVFLLQDAMTPELREGLGFDLVIPIKTVYDVLRNAGAEGALRSEWIATATMEILPDGKSRTQIQREIKNKEYAIEYISRQFENEKISRELIKQCLYSIGDNSSYLTSNCKPVDYMIDHLKNYFSPDLITKDEDQWSLAIYGGQNGSRLTHSHARQYHYVLQSLTLWREIVHDMFRLWYVAEQDLLDPESRYKLKDTGQGVNRLQSAPRTSRAMHGILYEVQQRLGQSTQGWVGSSVIHLGDTNVPNALVFIDKYNQVPRILNPVVQCLKHLDNYVSKDDALMEYINEKYGGVENAKRTVLHDFFRGAFDGSGADNFFEAGSCIDGRLTSAWNWCQVLPEKPFFYLFRLSGFMGFDGNFQT